MKTLYFVTSNQGKIDAFNTFLHEVTNDFGFEMLKIDFEELKTDDSLERTAINKARTCSNLTKKDVIVCDNGLFIDCLNGFPGVNTGFTIKKIGNKGLLKLLENQSNRNAYFQVSLAYKDNDNNEKVFSSKVDVQITKEEIGNEGFGFDSIVESSGNSFAEIRDHPDKLKPYKDVIKQLVEFLKK